MKLLLLSKKTGGDQEEMSETNSKLPVNRRTINSIFQKEGLARENNKRVKAIIRFEADSPNDLWQTDIMGKIAFKNLGILYLIAILDDHSRFVPAGRWFQTQGKMHVF